MGFKAAFSDFSAVGVIGARGVDDMVCGLSRAGAGVSRRPIDLDDQSCRVEPAASARTQRRATEAETRARLAASRREGCALGARAMVRGTVDRLRLGRTSVGVAGSERDKCPSRAAARGQSRRVAAAVSGDTRRRKRWSPDGQAGERARTDGDAQRRKGRDNDRDGEHSSAARRLRPRDGLEPRHDALEDGVRIVVGASGCRVVEDYADAIAQRDRADVEERLDRTGVAREHGVVAQRPLRVRLLHDGDDAEVGDLCVDELMLISVDAPYVVEVGCALAASFLSQSPNEPEMRPSKPMLDLAALIRIESALSARAIARASSSVSSRLTWTGCGWTVQRGR